MPDIPYAFERLRREWKEQSATNRILGWFRELTPDPLVSPTWSRPPPENIPNHNSSTLQSSPLERKLSPFAPYRQKVEDSTRLWRATSPSSMDIFEDAVPSTAVPTKSSPRKRGRPKKVDTVEEQNPAIAMGHNIKSPLTLSSLSIDSFMLSSRSQEADISLSPKRSPSKTNTNTTRTASTVTKKEKLAYMTPPTRFITLER